MATKSKAKATTPLGTFDGRDVAAATIEVTNAGDGLSKGLKVEPTEYHIGERVWVALEVDVTEIKHKAIPDTQLLERVHRFKAGRAAIIDGDLVVDALNAQEQRIAEHRDVSAISDPDAGDDPGD